MDYEPVIALEIHAQLLTQSKIFCGCSTQFGAIQNSQVCPVCAGMPGTLPVLNQKVVELAIKMGLALNCRINAHSVFARKNYFYPDLPKGFQISQYAAPLCQEGFLEIEVEGVAQKIRIMRIHLEEDAGKSIHAEAFVPEDQTFIDLNRCGVPLIEIVTQPDFRAPAAAFVFLKQICQIVQYLEICDGNLAEGSVRCDANISLRPVGTTKLGVKTEIKNLNSFHGVVKALEFEIDRQSAVLESGGRVIHETLLWDAQMNRAIPMRSKEIAPDYRYFPEPDLAPLQVSQALIESIQADLPELPAARKKRFIEHYQLSDYDAAIITENREIADYFEQCLQDTSFSKDVSNWIMGEVLHFLNNNKIKISAFPIIPQNLAALINLINQGTISRKIGKTVFEKMTATGKSPENIIEAEGLNQLSDISKLTPVIQDVLESNLNQVVQYRNGKKKLLGYFIGQVMQQTAGKANPQIVRALLMKKLDAFK